MWKATRQYVAQSNSWSLEELTLKMSVLDNNTKPSLDECSFGLTGLKLQGALCQNNKISLSPNIVNNFNVSVIRWSREANDDTDAKTATGFKINLPIYLNSTRSELLFTIKMDTDQNENLFFMRGVAILASNLGGWTVEIVKPEFIFGFFKLKDWIKRKHLFLLFDNWLIFTVFNRNFGLLIFIHQMDFYFLNSNLLQIYLVDFFLIIKMF